MEVYSSTQNPTQVCFCLYLPILTRRNLNLCISGRTNVECFVPDSSSGLLQVQHCVGVGLNRPQHKITVRLLIPAKYAEPVDVRLKKCFVWLFCGLA